ncbi:MAG: glutathione S-transferase family protein [Myxococcota bacterium]
MKLDPASLRTKEVLAWEGVHLLHFSQSGCSQKVRILLAEKGVSYRAMDVDILHGANATPWFLGINPRGLVPVLVHDGDVHVESNDILRYVDAAFPSERSWMPEGAAEERILGELLDLEDALHLPLRVVTMGFLAPPAAVKKSAAELQAYARNGAEDPTRRAQVAWWRAFGERGGVSPDEARDAVRAFRRAFTELDAIAAEGPWLLGQHPTVLDIAWFISLHRVALAGYPLEAHPHLARLYARMKARPAWTRELAKGPLHVRLGGPVYRAWRQLRGTTLRAVDA